MRVRTRATILDPHHAECLGLQWIESSLHGMPMHLLDDVGGVPTTLRAAVENILARGADETVVVGQQEAGRWRIAPRM